MADVTVVFILERRRWHITPLRMCRGVLVTVIHVPSEQHTEQSTGHGANDGTDGWL